MLGFGSQGHAHAQNLRDSGLRRRVGLREVVELGRGEEARALREGDRRGRRGGRRRDGAAPRHRRTPAAYAADIAPNLSAGDMLMFAHGFSIHFGRCSRPPTWT